MTAPPKRDHGGGLDAAIAHYGGSRADWIDLSTGINPVPYPLPEIPARFWQALPDSGDQTSLKTAARSFWDIPETADLIAASGVSALIATLPRLATVGHVGIATPTYNEHAAAFKTFGWHVRETASSANVYVHPNNPDGRRWNREEIRANHQTLTVIDESFCDVCPDQSHIHLAAEPGYVVLKGLGKFWGLAGLRLGFAVALPETITKLTEMIGPWAISGPAQHIGRIALSDNIWAEKNRQRLARDANRLDRIMAHTGSQNPRGTSLFRLYDVTDASALHEKLARSHIHSRIFPYSQTLIRLGLPAADENWTRLQNVVEN